MRMVSIKQVSHGFTIIELMIASSVLAVLLIIIAYTSVAVGKAYYKAVSSSRTQETGRRVSADVSDKIAYSTDDPHYSAAVKGTPGTPGVICIGNTRYSFTIDDVRVSSAQHVFWKDKISGACTAPTAAGMASSGQLTGGTDGQELLGEKMQLKEFTATQSAGSPDYWSFKLTVALGDASVFDADGTCYSSNKGGEFCGISTQSFGVFRRKQ